MNIQSTPQVYQPNLNPLQKTNTMTQVSFKGLEHDSVEISNKENTSFISKLKGFFSKSLKPLTPEEKLKSMGISDETSEKFLEIIKTSEKTELNNNFKALVSDLPKIKDKELLGYFICFRALASRDSLLPDTYKINKDAFNSFNNIYNAYPSLHNSDSLKVLTEAVSWNQRGDAKENFSNIEKYIDKDENAYHYLTALSLRRYSDNKDSYGLFKDFMESGCEKNSLCSSFVCRQYPFNYKEDSALSKFKDLKNEGIESEYLLPMLDKVSKKENIIRLCDFMKKADEKRSMLGSADFPVEKVDMVNLFLDGEKSVRTLNLIDLWGEDTVLSSFSDGYNKVDDYVAYFGNSECDFKYMQPFIELVNPTNSELYKDLSDRIKTLKSGFADVKDDAERKKLIEEINTLSKQRNNLVSNSIKDTTEKINATQVYIGLVNDDPSTAEDYEASNAIVPFMNPKTVEEKMLYKEKLNELIWKKFGIECPEKLKEGLDFTDSKYLEKMFFPSVDFCKNFKNLVKILNKSKKNIPNTLDNLPQNKLLAETFQKSVLSYKVWTGSLPNLKMEFDIQNDFESMSKNAVRNLENEFNDVIYKDIPKSQRDKLEKSLLKGGYSLVEKEEVNYDNAGFYEGTTRKISILKEDKPIEFKDLSKIFKILDTEFNTDSFWKAEHSSSSVNNAKGTFKDHIASRHAEMKRVRQCKNSETSHIQIQKVDMNDIKHSLFLGNDAACCTAIGSFNDWTAPLYIKNKMIQAIELKDGDEYIGNTMMFLANINGVTGLFLDNIELKPKYQYNDKIEEGIIEFAKKFVKELGAPNMDIYAGPNRHKLDMKNFELFEADDIQLIGSTGGEKIYFDFITDDMDMSIDKSFSGDIFKLKK